MRIPTLLYHDVVPEGELAGSGFCGPGSDLYKLTRDAFRGHLDSLARLGGRPHGVSEEPGDGAWRITFDDGGLSALTEIAPLLEERGWRGYFFMTSGVIGKPGFLDSEGLRELVRRGHHVGSHTVSHPLIMASLPAERLAWEWRESTDRLEEILGFRPDVASISGGAYSRTVAETAGQAGIRHLFTSEPTPRQWQVGPVTCYGRYTLWQGMAPEVAVQCVTGRGLWPLRQRVTWDAKKAAKAMMGPVFRALRERVLSRRQGADSLETAGETTLTPEGIRSVLPSG